MKIGLICPYSLDLPGGVQHQVRFLASEIRNRGHEAVIVGPGVETAPPGEVRLGRTMSMPGNGSVAPLLLNPTRRNAFMEAIGPMDVLHVHEPALPALGWWAARSGMPQVHTFHADAPRRRGAVGRAIINWLPSPATGVAVSAVAAANWRRSLEIVPNAVEAVTLRSNRQRGQVVCIGRDEHRKGISVLVDAWPNVLKAVPHARLHLTTGADPSPGIAQHGLLSTEAKWELLASSEVAVSPNRFGESFGLVVAEALACGTPLVMSDLPAFRAVADTAAVVVPPGDAEALGAAIIALLNDPEERERRSVLGREVVKRFGVVGIVDRYLDLYQGAVEQQ
jgi:phosphatidylinositol alpha-mannosyltransferase